MADEIKQVMEALDRVEGKMDETSKSNAAELKRLGEEQTKLSRQLMELQQKGVAAKQEAEVKTAGGSVRISVSGEVIPGAAQRGCPLYLRCSMPDLMR